MKRIISHYYQLYLNNRSYKSKLLFYTALLLAIFGVVMQTSGAMTSSSMEVSAIILIFIKQLFWFVLSFICYGLFSIGFSHSFFNKHRFTIFIILIMSLTICLVFHAVGGAQAWIRFRLPVLGQVTIQPSEFCKTFFIVILASYLTDKSLTVEQLWVPIVFSGLAAFIMGAFQKDLGTAIIFTFIVLIVICCSKNKNARLFRILALLAIIMIIAGMIALTTDKGISLLQKIGIDDYKLVRFKAAMNPFSNRYGSGYYDLVNSLIGFNTGGLTGVGLGKSLRKYGYLSAANTDFIMAIIVEELGIFGFVFVLLCNLIIIFVLLIKGLRMKKIRDKIILVGFSSYFLLHFIFNIGGITCLIPLTGIPLLLVSSGGSSSISCMIVLGIAQNIIARGEKDAQDN